MTPVVIYSLEEQKAAKYEPRFSSNFGVKHRHSTSLRNHNLIRIENPKFLDPKDHSQCCDHAPEALSVYSTGDDSSQNGPRALNPHPKLVPNAMGLYASSYATQGPRKHMEDRHRVIFNKECRGAFSIFDGHGGYEAAAIASRVLHRYMFMEGSYKDGIKSKESSMQNQRGSLRSEDNKEAIARASITHPMAVSQSEITSQPDHTASAVTVVARPKSQASNTYPIHTITPQNQAASSRDREPPYNPDTFMRLIDQAFAYTEEEILQYSKRKSTSDGTTTVALFVDDCYLFVANLGDSRAVLCRGRQVVPLSRDHKPFAPAERERIEQLGGKVCPVMRERRSFFCGVRKVPFGADRMWPGGFSVSRAFGNFDYKDQRKLRGRPKTLIATPEISVTLISPDDQFVVLASDGLWDTMTSEEVLQFVLDRMDDPATFEPENIARDLCEHAVELGTRDNVTAIVVFFTHHQSHWN